MQKFLLSTALVAATAGIAQAEITLSGDARMGIINNFVLGAGDDNTTFTSRARVTFTMTGSSDSGLEFGASFRADNAGGAADGTAGSVYVSGAFGKLSMGDVDSAALAAVGHVDGVGLTGLGDHNEMIFIGAGGASPIVLNYSFFGPGGPGALAGPMVQDPTALYEYSTGALSFYASVTKPGHTWNEAVEDWTDAIAYAVGVSYSVDAYKFSIGYEQFNGTLQTAVPVDNKTDNLAIGADATFGAVTLKARYSEGGSRYDGGYAQDHDQWSLSATYAMDALSVTGYASHKQFSSLAGANLFTRDAIGVGASYDLGGGASVKGGIVQLEETTGAAAPVKDTAFDLGLSFTF